MENLNTDNLMRLQVEQLEKEKKGLAERLRFIAKRLDHTERAFRKEERPLLALDYERQQAEDRAAWEEAQKRALEEAKQAHRRNLETKKRLSRMLDDYRSRKDVYISSRGEEYARKKREAEKKIEKAKAERYGAVMKEREERRRKKEEEERKRKEREEEERRCEEGSFEDECSIVNAYTDIFCNLFFFFSERLAEEQRLKEEEEAARAAEETRRREEEADRELRRKQREEERQAAIEKARLQEQRAEEALARRAAEKAAAAKNLSSGRPTESAGVWRRGSTPSTPSRTASATQPARPESPSPAAGGTTRYRPPGARTDAPASGGGWRAREPVRGDSTPPTAPSGGGGWRAREMAKNEAAASGAGTPPRPASPAAADQNKTPPAPTTDGDGFTTVSNSKWGGSRLRRG